MLSWITLGADLTVRKKLKLERGVLQFHLPKDGLEWNMWRQCCDAGSDDCPCSLARSTL